MSRCSRCKRANGGGAFKKSNAMASRRSESRRADRWRRSDARAATHSWLPSGRGREAASTARPAKRGEDEERDRIEEGGIRTTFQRNKGRGLSVTSAAHSALRLGEVWRDAGFGRGMRGVRRAASASSASSAARARRHPAGARWPVTSRGGHARFRAWRICVIGAAKRRCRVFGPLAPCLLALDE